MYGTCGYAKDWQKFIADASPPPSDQSWSPSSTSSSSTPSRRSKIVATTTCNYTVQEIKPPAGNLDRIAPCLAVGQKFLSLRGTTKQRVSSDEAINHQQSSSSSSPSSSSSCGPGSAVVVIMPRGKDPGNPFFFMIDFVNISIVKLNKNISRPN